MSAPKIGSLFSGYAGLDRAVEEFFGAKPAWFVEFDAAPSKILAAHYPGVPNHGDVTTTDWSKVEPVDIMTGGFPCQDVSLAGARAGLKDGTRSGLWSEFARAIGVLRPQYVVIENVRGLLSAAAGDSEEWTDADLGDLGEVESGAPGVGDGRGGPALRAAGAVLADLAELGYDAQWCAVRASDAGAPHQRYRVFILAHAHGFGSERSWDSRYGRAGSAVPRAGVAADLMPTPQVADSTGGHALRSGARSGELLLPGLVQTLRTPTASEADGGRRNPQRAGATMRLSDQIAEAKLPTPVVTDLNGARNATSGRKEGSIHHSGQTLTDVSWVLPKLDAVEEYTALWEALEDQSPFWVTAAGVDYWPAISRWAQIMGHPSPSPTLPDGKNGNHRLNPAFTEWLMGQPAGWITGVGLTRNEALKACGNGVVTQQALLALSILWPYVSYELAA